VRALAAALACASALLSASLAAHADDSLAARNERLFEELQASHGLSPEQMRRIRAIFHGSRIIGQGNPAVTEHPMTPAECATTWRTRGESPANGTFERVCGAKFMAPLYDPTHEAPEDARACIDQFEFPDIPCAYPVVWVKAKEAAELCEAEGKRLCDAHEWEGACDGRLLPADYRFDLAQGATPEVAISRMRAAHNREYSPVKRWSYGLDYERGICAAASHKSAGCNGGNWAQCGSNTYPAGSFPLCHSPLGVYDLNGNAAEHMNLPLDPGQMSSRGSPTLGYTEMKGSWFIFDTDRAHEDWCRWRAPYWHGSRVMDPLSHANYHLGFRCCKTLAKPTPAATPTGR
jgi:formylglycine-generating enzyme required for sulfatase activity